MKRGACFQAALEILELFHQTKSPLDRLCQTYFKDRRYIGSHDRRQISELVYACVRQWGVFLDGARKNGLPETPRSFLMLYAALKKENLSSLFSGDQHHPSRLSHQEQSAVQSFLSSLNQGESPPFVTYAYPEWMDPLLQEVLGDAFNSELEALKDPASFDLRIHPLREQRETLKKELEKQGYPCELTRHSPLGLRSSKRFPLDQSPSFREGRVEVQDEGSQLVCLLARVHASHQVMDYCAGAGGKTLLLSALMENKGQIIATDVHDKRLQEAKKRLKRAKAENVQCHVIPETGSCSFLASLEGRMDRVLVDAPCSGSGTWRRNPDLKWRFSPKDLEELQKKQQTILKESARYVKPGGWLIYVTCSLFSQENEKQIDSFLKSMPFFEVLEVASLWQETLGTPYVGKEGPFLRLTPFQHGTDGFFMAVLKRTSP